MTDALRGQILCFTVHAKFFPWQTGQINEEYNPKDYEKAILETSCWKKYIV